MSQQIVDVAMNKNIVVQRRKLREYIRKIKMYRRVEFLRWLWWKFDKFENKLRWRRPKGKDNPVRLSYKGYPPKPDSGYRLPRDIRNLHPSGLIPIRVSNIKELEALDPRKHIIYIASSVGTKKRLEIISKAREKGFRIANEMV